MNAAVWVAPGLVAVEDLVTHRLPLSRLAEGVVLAAEHRAVKVFVTGAPA